MSNAGEDTSLGSGEDDPTPETAPVADPPTDDRIVDELEEQEQKGWLNEPTTG